MSEKEERVLGELAAQILFLIWKRREGFERGPHAEKARGVGMTQAEISRALPQRLQRSPARLNTLLRELAARRPALLERHAAQPFQRKDGGGDAPAAYAIPTGRTVTWPSSARILVEIFQHADYVNKDALEARILEKLKLINPSDGAPMKKRDLDDQLAYCKKHNYIEFIADGARIRALPRLERELPFFMLLADFKEE